MQVKDIARESDGEREEIVMTLVASEEDIDASAKEFFAEIAKRDIPGFRKGKAPREILEQQVGGHANAMGGVAETLINEYAPQAIDDTGIIFINDPTFNVEDALVEGQPFIFTVSGEVAPTMKLTSYEPVSIEMPPEEATEKDIENQLRSIQDYYHSFENIDDGDHVAEKGDYVNIELTVSKDNQVLRGMHKVKRLIGLGEGTMPDSFDEQIIGSKVGDVLEFDFDASDESGKSDFGDGDLHAVAEILGFRTKTVPAIDDELAQKVGATDVEDMKKHIERNIAVQKAQELPRIKVDRAIEAALSRLDGDVPAYYVDFIRQDVGREFMQSLQEQGVNLQEWLLQNSINGDDMKDDISREAQRRAAIDCMLEAVFDHAGLEITDADIDDMFGGDEPAVVREDWERAHRMAEVKKMCRQHKATQWLVENADVEIVEE